MLFYRHTVQSWSDSVRQTMAGDGYAVHFGVHLWMRNPYLYCYQGDIGFLIQETLQMNACQFQPLQFSNSVTCVLAVGKNGEKLVNLEVDLWADLV